MKIILMMVGKTDSTIYDRLIADYAERLNKYLPFSTMILPDIRKTENMPPQQRKEKEGELILRALSPSDNLILLDERGREHTSEEFAAYLGGRLNSGCKRLLFAIGGPFGFSEKVYAAASARLSLSRMTFSHQMVRLIFVEQAYRAMTILRNEGYHHG
ncbi:MAG: 23S rRNA (pseudouridine(1915)-N(3))-methyltransferase RlmH [Tannerellaceae bacterium]|jgi:23S rRNA (pseudouridine1915-N3)-methyltransferase|nr:23S rRNA (pseudouridine(1915)-N(3))-methyltransferase RlmH [Tannerellaceae bacterium]